MTMRDRACGVILLCPDCSEVLIVYQNQSGQWGLPKGHAEEQCVPAETALECAVRELHEETGVRRDAYSIFGEVSLGTDVFFVARLGGSGSGQGQVRSAVRIDINDKKEIGAVRWVPVKSLAVFVANHRCNVTLKRLRDFVRCNAYRLGARAFASDAYVNYGRWDCLDAFGRRTPRRDSTASATNRTTSTLTLLPSCL